MIRQLIQRSPLVTISILALTVLLSFANLFMVVPIFTPKLLNTHTLLVPFSTTHAMRTLLIGLLIASYGIGLFIGGILLGELSDQQGRKKIIILSLILSVFSCLLGAYGLWKNSLTALFICRLIGGIAAGNGSVIFAVASSLAEDAKQRGIYLGYISGAASIGSIIGPLLGVHLSMPFITIGITFLLNMLLLIMLPIKNNIYQSKKSSFANSLSDLFACIKMPTLNTLLWAYFFFVMGTECIFAGLPIFAANKFSVNSDWLGNLFAILGLVAALSSLVLNKIISHFLQSKSIILAGCVILIMAFICLYIPKSANGLFIVTGFIGLACVLVWAHSNAIIADRVDESIQGRVLGVTQSTLALAILIGPTLVGLLAAINYRYAILVPIVSTVTALVIFIFKISTGRTNNDVSSRCSITHSINH